MEPAPPAQFECFQAKSTNQRQWDYLLACVNRDMLSSVSATPALTWKWKPRTKTKFTNFNLGAILAKASNKRVATG
jgi:hypothetical protein